MQILNIQIYFYYLIVNIYSNLQAIINQVVIIIFYIIILCFKHSRDNHHQLQLQAMQDHVIHPFLYYRLL